MLILVAFYQQSETVCALYKGAFSLQAQGTHLVSTDEKTGIQAKERTHPTRRMRPGRIEYQEFEYKRHGTCCLIANFEVATGQVLGPTVGAQRTEEDFADYILHTVASDLESSWIFIVDNLNTHQSESLVALVADVCDLDENLGKKGRSGILQSQATRAAFLSDPTHRIRFVYTPKHASWLN